MARSQTWMVPSRVPWLARRKPSGENASQIAGHGELGARRTHIVAIGPRIGGEGEAARDRPAADEHAGSKHACRAAGEDSRYQGQTAERRSEGAAHRDRASRLGSRGFGHGRDIGVGVDAKQKPDSKLASNIGTISYVTY